MCYRLLRVLAIVAVAVAAPSLIISAAGPANFKPDGIFTGSSLAGWHVVGDAVWKAENGELVGTAKSGANGGWLVMDRSFQDVQLYTSYRCTGTCTAGVLLRAQKTADGGLSGVYVSLTDGDTASYAVTIDPAGKELTRERLAGPAGRGGGAARGAAPGAAGAPPAGAPATGAPAGNAPATSPTPAGPTGAGRAAPPGTQVGSSGRRPPVLKPGEWNDVYILAAAATLRQTFGGATTVDEKNVNGYGPVALYVGGTGEVRYKDFAWKDLNSIVEPKESVSSHFAIQRVSSLYYGWGATTIQRCGTIIHSYTDGDEDRDSRGKVEIGRVGNTLTPIAADDVSFVSDDELLVVQSIGDSTVLKAQTLADPSAVLWQQIVNNISEPTLSFNHGTRRWALLGWNGEDTILRVEGGLDGSAIERTQWSIKQDEEDYISAMASSGPDALFFATRYEPSFAARALPWRWTWARLMVPGHSISHYTRVAKHGRQTSPESRLDITCMPDVVPGGLGCTAYDGSRTHIVTIAPGSDRVQCVGFLEGQFTTNRSGVDGWITGWIAGGAAAVHVSTGEVFHVMPRMRTLRLVPTTGERVAVLTFVANRVQAAVYALTIPTAAADPGFRGPAASLP